MRTANGINASASAASPPKKGFFASAHVWIELSNFVSTPARNAIRMPAIAPPAM